ncbi:MAG TPA: VOC family protein [Microlunatus sp.]|nr:VOC family protein [Microlunatus sp.]
MNELPELQIMSVKIPVSDLAASRRWYADVFGLRVVMEWPDADGVVRGVALSGLGTVLLALREHPAAAAATHGFGFLNVQVPREEDLSECATHLDRLQISHTPVISGASGRLVGFHDLDGHELSFYAQTTTDGVREDAIRHVQMAGQPITPAT